MTLSLLYRHLALLALPLSLATLAVVPGRAQDPAHAKELRLQNPGKGPGGEPRIAFLAHRLGNDHAEGISMLDMNGDERRAMGERGREKVTSEFDERMVVERYKELLQTLTGVSL